VAHNTTVTVNVALSLNGMMAGRNGRRVRISGNEDMERVHRLRAESDAILVGARTIINDNPYLGINEKYLMSDRRPARIILDEHLRIPENSNVLNDQQETIIFSSSSREELGHARIVRREKEGLYMEKILDDLGSMGFRNILVEGGRDVINQLIRSRRIDHFYIYLGNIIIEEDGMPLFRHTHEMKLKFLEVSGLGEGVIINLDPQSLYI
jgi:2,5-diamino-6-(ribosylamino)-4(3H)-pyrimidinone 5'-phosphate reductase